MFKFQSGVLDKTRLVANILMLILLAGNLFFSVQYVQSIVAYQSGAAAAAEAKDTARLMNARLMKSFVNVVLDTKGTVSLEDRVALENDVRQTHDSEIIKLWDAFVASKDGTVAQSNAVKFIVVLANKML